MTHYKHRNCNISRCEEVEYKDHMCKEHYDFYSSNSATLKVMEEVHALENGNAGWRLKLKKVFHWILHLSLDVPMPLYEHFPLEHVYLAELETLRKGNPVDVARAQKVISDFDIPENENIAAMKRLLAFRDIETSELGPKSNYLLGKRDMPSMILPLISVLGFVLLYCFFEWMAPANLVVRGADYPQVYMAYWRYIPYVYAFALFTILGMMIPSQYNFLIDRSYNLTLFKRGEDNADLVNQVKYVKERKGRAGSYYATLFGSSIGTTAALFWALLGKGTVITAHAVLLCCAVALSVVPLVFAFSEMALFYPVIESLKRKRISIDLYNADHRGGLKRYHRLLYLTILYNEGIAAVLMALFKVLIIPKGWIVLLILLLLPRFNHAGWAIFGWIRSIVDFYRAKNEEKSRLVVQEGSVENMGKAELLKKVHPIGLIPLALAMVSYVIAPYIINQLPRWHELLVWMGLIKP